MPLIDENGDERHDFMGTTRVREYDARPPTVPISCERHAIVLPTDEASRKGSTDES
jgi:hypothetical protein